MAKDYVDVGIGGVIGGRALTVKTSRSYYYGNYILAALVLFLASIVYLHFNLAFYLFPHTVEEFGNTIIVFAFFAVIIYLIEESEIERVMRNYMITNNEVAKVEGIVRKTRVSIPHANISDIRVQKGVVGRILNFGDVDVVGFKGQIKIKGVKNPEMIYRLIENKIAVMRRRGRGEKEEIEAGFKKGAKKKHKK